MQGVKYEIYGRFYTSTLLLGKENVAHIVNHSQKREKGLAVHKQTISERR
jgi:hypothetical protein